MAPPGCRVQCSDFIDALVERALVVFLVGTKDVRVVPATRKSVLRSCFISSLKAPRDAWGRNLFIESASGLGRRKNRQRE
jgi:hypothetical protein